MPGSREVQVPVTTIDLLVEELALPTVDFIKMDIEGAERQALAGAKITLARHRPRMAICVYHLPDDPVLLPQLILSIVPDYRVRRQCLNYQDSIQAEVAHFYH